MSTGVDLGLDLSFWDYLSPEQKKQYLAAGIAPGENKILDEQIARADAMRTTAMPSGRQAGNVYVAASPLEAIGTVMNRVQGQQQVDALTAKQRANLDKQTATNEGFLDAASRATADAKAAREARIQTMRQQRKGIPPLLRRPTNGADLLPSEDEMDAYYERAGYDYQP